MFCVLQIEQFERPQPMVCKSCSRFDELCICGTGYASGDESKTVVFDLADDGSHFNGMPEYKAIRLLPDFEAKAGCKLKFICCRMGSPVLAVFEKI